MAKASPSDITNAELSEKLDTLSQAVEKFTATIPVLIQQKIDELAGSVQRGFTTMQEQNEREHEELRSEFQNGLSELRSENTREHEETRSLIADKADLYEVVKHPEFDRLEQRVTQLELR